MTTKIICNFVLPGSVMLAPSECENSENPNRSKSFTHCSIKIFDKRTNKHDYVDYYVRKYKDAYQSLNVSDIAYEWWVSPDSFLAARESKGNWKKMSEHERINAHLKLIANDLKAKSYTFEVLPD